MEKIVAGNPETRSADVVSDSLERLKALFPEAFTEGRINFEVLRQLLGDTVNESEEKYGLNWHGKRRARQLSLTPSTGTLRPCPEDSVDWHKTQNLMLEGDNLEVLKILQKSYAGKIKLIYIDPPYNTGKDFIYTDNFRDSIRNYFQLTNQVDGENHKLSSNTEASGRFHTDWLNMIYPRLKVARNLLRQDGAIFVSIDDNELHTLRAVMNDLFGEENFVATIIWHKMDSPKNSAIHFSVDHDYILVFAKDSQIWRPNNLPRTEKMLARYKNPDNDPRGPWLLSDLAARNQYSEGRYSITTKSGRVIPGPPAGSYWRVRKEKFDELDRDNRIWWGESGDNRPGIKRFLSEVRQGVVPQTYWTWRDVGSTRNAKQELSDVMGAASGEDLFVTPKPTKLIDRILQIGTVVGKDDIVLDFFCGSGSTGHSVLQFNEKEQSNLRYILCQLPEPTGFTKFPTIAELAKGRLRRAAHRIKEGNPNYAGDLGFRVLKLDTSNIRAWDPKSSNLEGALLAALDHIESGRTEHDILYELILKLGLDLCVTIETRIIVGKSIHSVGAGTLVACLDEAISRDDVQPLALGIADWHDALAPAGECTVVFRDSAFADDVAKTNLAETLKQRGLGNVRSL